MSIKWIACLACLAAPGAAFAQSSDAQQEDEWEITSSVYGWFPGITTTVATPIGEVQAEQSFGDLLETLDLAFLGALRARKGRLTLVGDFLYFDITADEDANGPAGAFIDGIEIESQVLVFSGNATYAVVVTPPTRLGLGAGARFINADVETAVLRPEEVGNGNFTNDAG